MKKVLALLLAITVSGSILVPTTNAIETTSIRSDNMTKGKDSRITIPWKWVGKGFGILSKAISNFFVFTQPASIQYGTNNTSVHSGSYDFNNAENGSLLQHDLAFEDFISQSAWLWGERNPLLLGKVAINIFPKGSTTPVVSTSLSATQQYHFAPGQLGEWLVQYTNSSSTKWSFHYSFNHRYRTDLPEPYSVSNIEKEYTTVGDHIYLTPSKSHINGVKSVNATNIFFNLEELSNNLWDQELGDYVYNFKSFNPGDKVNFSDIITGISYNSNEDRTYFNFISETHGDVSWPFKGDLSQSFKIGDNLKLKFTVEKRDGAFEILDYVRMDIDGVTAELKDFIIE